MPNFRSFSVSKMQFFITIFSKHCNTVFYRLIYDTFMKFQMIQKRELTCKINSALHQPRFSLFTFHLCTNKKSSYGQPHFLSLSLHISPDGVAVGENSAVGNAICLNKLHGSSTVGKTHSFSGTEYSTALIKYCAGRSMRTTEKNPSETSKVFVFASSARSCDRCAQTQSGISSTVQQQEQRQDFPGSTTFVPRMMGSTVSITAIK